MRLIGITGRPGVGKSTVARMLADQYDMVTVVTFNEMIQLAVRNTFNIPRDFPIREAHPYLQEASINDVIPKFDKWVRETIGEDVWVTQMRDRIESYVSRTIIIPDVRFKNEAQMIKDMGGKILKIKPEGSDVQGRMGKGSLPDGWVDYTLLNNHDYGLEWLQKQVRKLADQWG